MKKWLTISVLLNIILLLSFGIKNIFTNAKLKEDVKNFQIDHYLTKSKLAEQMNIQDSVIIFLGDSQIEYGNWNELLQRNDILNRGIAGDVVSGLLGRVEEVCRHQPSKIFIQIGTNDLSMDLSPKEIIKDYTLLIDEIQQRCTAQIYVNAVLPVQDLPGEFYQNSIILALNRSLKQLCQSKSIEYINLNDTFTDELGNLKSTLTNDGLHLNDKGYLVWAKILKPFF